MGWLVVQVGATREAAAAARLRLRDLEVFFPHEAVTRRVRSGNRFRLVETTEALWPGYLFVNSIGSEAVEADGQSRVVRVAGCPVRLGSEAVAVLQAGADADGLVKRVDRATPVIDAKKGDVVEIDQGVMAGFRARVVDLQKLADGLVGVEFTLLGRTNQVYVPAEAVGNIVQRAKARRRKTKATTTGAVAQAA